MSPEDEPVYASGEAGLDGPAGHPHQSFCECGEAWFEGAVLAFEKDGSVNGMTGFLRCIGCGTPRWGEPA